MSEWNHDEPELRKDASPDKEKLAPEKLAPGEIDWSTAAGRLVAAHRVAIVQRNSASEDLVECEREIAGLEALLEALPRKLSPDADRMLRRMIDDSRAYRTARRRRS